MIADDVRIYQNFGEPKKEEKKEEKKSEPQVLGDQARLSITKEENFQETPSCPESADWPSAKLDTLAEQMAVVPMGTRLPDHVRDCLKDLSDSQLDYVHKMTVKIKDAGRHAARVANAAALFKPDPDPDLAPSTHFRDVTRTRDVPSFDGGKSMLPPAPSTDFKNVKWIRGYYSNFSGKVPFAFRNTAKSSDGGKFPFDDSLEDVGNPGKMSAVLDLSGQAPNFQHLMIEIRRRLVLSEADLDLSAFNKETEQSIPIQLFLGLVHKGGLVSIEYDPDTKSMDLALVSSLAEKLDELGNLQPSDVLYSAKTVRLVGKTNTGRRLGDGQLADGRVWGAFVDDPSTRPQSSYIPTTTKTHEQVAKEDTIKTHERLAKEEQGREKYGDRNWDMITKALEQAATRPLTGDELRSVEQNLQVAARMRNARDR